MKEKVKNGIVIKCIRTHAALPAHADVHVYLCSGSCSSSCAMLLRIASAKRRSFHANTNDNSAHAQNVI